MNRKLTCGVAAFVMALAHASYAPAQSAIDDKYVYVVYGAMLCDSAYNAAIMRLSLMQGFGGGQALPYCQATFGGWAERLKWGPAVYGMPLVKLIGSGEQGWVAQLEGYLTCQDYDRIRPRVPGARPTPSFCAKNAATSAK